MALVAVLLAAAVSLGLLVDGILALPSSGEGYEGTEFGGRVLISASPWLLATAYGWLAWGLVARRAPARCGAVVLAVLVLVAGLFTDVAAGAGPVVAMLAVGLALVVGVEPSVREVLVRSASPVATARLLTLWWTAGSAYAMCFAFNRAGYRSVEPLDAAASTDAGVLFLLLVAVGVAVLVAIPRRSGLFRWVLAGALVLDVVAVALVDAGNHLLWPLLGLHVAAALALLLPARARAHFGEEPLAAVTVVGAWWVRLLERPLPWLRCWVAGIVVLTGLVVALASISASGYDDSTAASTGSSVLGSVVAVLVGLLCVASAFTPTMPWWWRSGLGVGAITMFALGATTEDLLDSTGHTVMWIVVVPTLLVGTSVWGAWTNHRNGVTSAHPGWVGPGSLPPSSSPAFPLPPTAGGRSRIQLHADLALDPDAALAAVQRVCAVRGNWFLVQGDRVVCGASDGSTVALSIGSGGSGHAHFRARARRLGPRTMLTVGGLDRWLQRRSYYAGFIPAGPAHVLGFFMYRLFLQTVSGELRRLDPAAQITFRSSRTEDQ